MPKPSVFLSHSFNEKDKKVVEFFKNILEEHFVVNAATEEDADKVLDKIYPKINDSDALCAIFTKRYETKDDKLIPPSNVIHEVGYACRAGKYILGFLQKGIELRDVGLIGFEGINLPEFIPSELDDSKRKKFESFVRELSIFQKYPEGSFIYSGYYKDVTIYTSGYSVIRHRYKVKVKTKSFKGISHFFDLGPSAKKGAVLPQDLLDNPEYKKVQNRWKRKVFFRYRLWGDEEKAPFTESDIKVIKDMRESSEEKVAFRMEFPLGSIGDEICYEWAIGFQGLFPITKKELAPGKRLEDESEVISSADVSRAEIEPNAFVFVVRFEGDPEFEQRPYLRCLESGKNAVACKEELIVQKSALYTNYVLETDVSKLRGFVELRWVPK